MSATEMPVPKGRPQGGDSTTTHPITPTGKDATMSTDDRTETITDRAAIRDSADEREPERVCCDGGHANFPPLPDDPETTPEQRAGLDEVLAKVWPDPAPGATVGALDLDAIEGRARYDLEWGDGANKEMVLALVAYARRKSTLAADNHAHAEAAEAEVRSLRAKVAAVEALPDEWMALTSTVLATKQDHWRGDDYVDGREFGIEMCADSLRAALATGEGK